MKKYIIASILLVSTASITSYTLKQKQNEIKICHSEIVWIKDNGTQDGLNMKSKVAIQLDQDNHDRMNLYGYIKNNEVTYRLDRAVYFDYHAVDYKNNYVINFKTLSITSSDSTPESIFSKFIQLEKDKIKYYVNITKMDDNIYILNDESYSSFTCNIK